MKAFQQFRWAFRSLRKRPAYSLVAILTLGLGIGATTAIFTVANAVLLRPPAFQSPEKIMVLTSLSKDPAGKMEDFGCSIYDYLDWRDRNEVFSSLATMDQSSVSLTGSGEPQQVDAGVVSANFFDTLGVKLTAGRTFHQEEESEASHVVILSYGLWQRSFGGNADAVGRTLFLDGVGYSIAGVAPRGFFLISPAELWTPMNLQLDRASRTQNRNLVVVGRLRAGVTQKVAGQEMSGIAEQLGKEFPETNRDWGVRVDTLQSSLVKDVRPAITVLLASVGFLLLITCANVANLSLARAVERESEVAVLVALGAGKMEVFQRMLAEGLLIAVAGGLLGIILTACFLGPIIALSPLASVGSTFVPILQNVSIDGRVLLFTASVSMLAVLLAGILPSFRRGRKDLSAHLKENSRRSAGSFGTRRLQKILVVAELALSFVLLAGAVFLMKSFVNLRQVHPGFESGNRLTMRMNLPASRYDTPEKRSLFVRTLLEQIKAIPGVVSAGTSTRLPLNEFSMVTLFEVEGHPPANPGDGEVTNFRRISYDYFKAMGIKQLEGREFGMQDVAGGLPVAVVSRETEHRYWPGQSAIGKRIRRFSPSDRVWRTIVGVVDDVHDESLAVAPTPTLYIPYLQGAIPGLYLVVNVSGNPVSLSRALQQQIWKIDPDLAVYDIKTLDVLFRESLSRPRFYTLLMSLFAGLGLLVGTIGVYGVTSYSVTQRTGEIAVRLALGAQRRSVLLMALKETSKLAVIGTVLGFCGSIALVKVLASFAPGIPPERFVILSSVLLLLFGVSVIAAWIPANRASKLDPILALRYE